MPNGLRIRDPNTGQVIVDITDRLTKVVGVTSTGTSNGSISPPAFSQGTPFFCVLSPPLDFESYVYPTLYVDGNRIRWEFTDYYLPNESVDFVYGIYT